MQNYENTFITSFNRSQTKFYLCNPDHKASFMSKRVNLNDFLAGEKRRKSNSISLRSSSDGAELDCFLVYHYLKV